MSVSSVSLTKLVDADKGLMGRDLDVSRSWLEICRKDEARGRRAVVGTSISFSSRNSMRRLITPRFSSSVTTTVRTEAAITFLQKFIS